MGEGSETAKELAALRKEIYEARTLTIRNDNLLKTFHAELKAVADRQARAERRHFVGHVAAYVVIGVLAGGGALFYTHMMVDAERAALEDRIAEAEQAQEAARLSQEQADQRIETMEAQARRALNIHRLLTSADEADRAGGLVALEKVDPAELDPFARTVLLSAEGEERRESAQKAFDEAQAHYRKGRMREAAAALDQLRHHLEALPAGWGADLRTMGDYYSGATYARLGRGPEARPFLERFIASEAPKANRAQAHVILGDVLLGAGAEEEAKKVWREGLKVDPAGRATATLRRKLGLPAAAGAAEEDGDAAPAD
ncbi:MAG: hypothetical protein P1V51_06270 [Deltaproteobacteria bacterium]|nr:hypothetical protein [Deltaproteobacteria bacterium]